MANAGMVKSGGTAVAREGFGSRELEQRFETASSAVAAQVQAETQAMYVMALQRPRDWDNVRTKLLAECKRTRFAAGAFFSIPRGDKPGKITRLANRIEGLSVRFTEAAIRMAGNILQRSRTIYDDDSKRIVAVACIDLESNTVYARDVIVEKTLERRSVKEGQEILAERLNSEGKKVFLVLATEDEIQQKEGSLVSKTFRTLGQRLIPSDIRDEAEDEIGKAVHAEVARDPTAARKALVDTFAKIGIQASDLKEYVGHELDACTNAETVELGGLFAAVRDGEVTWKDALAAKRGKPTEAADASGGGAVDVTAKVKARAEKIAAKKRGAAAPAAKEAPKQEQQGPAKEAPAPSTKCAGCKEEVDFRKDGQVLNGVTWHASCLAEAKKAEQALGGRQPGED